MTSTEPNYRHLLNRYALYAPAYDALWGRYSAATLSKALEAIPAGGELSSLVDVACGTGLLAAMLLRRRPRLRFTGVDISSQMLEKARHRIPPEPGRIEWLEGHAEELPVDNASCDVLTCTNAFHLVQDAPAALAEFRRVLKPDGVLVLVDWCRDFPLMKIRDAVMRFSDRQRRQIRGLPELVELLESSDFRIQSGERFRAGLWGLMCVTAQNRAPRTAHGASKSALSPAGGHAAR